MNESVRQKSYERPLYAGNTSYFYLKIIPLIIATWFCVVVFVAALGLFVASILGELGDIMIYASAGAMGLFLVLALVFNLIRARHLSSIQYDPEIFGDKKSSKEIRDHADHSRLKFIYFRIYKDRIVINDYSGLHEWVYLLKGTYHIRVRQTFSGRAWNYGTVILASVGTGGRNIAFNGIKDPHGLKRFFEASMQSEKIGVGAMIPH